MQCDAEMRPMIPPPDTSGALPSASEHRRRTLAVSPRCLRCPGTTAVAVFITPTHLICANAGDSRSVYCKGEVVALSEDHKPDNPDERARIERAGGHVAQGMMGMGPMRVDGDLAVSRCLGDFEYKQNKQLPPVEQKVSPLPECRICQRDPSKDELLILACDGIWDVMTNEECCDALRELLMEGERDMGLVAEECLMMCLDKESKDNMSAVVVAFPAAKYGQGRGVAARVEAREARQRAEDERGGGGGGRQ